MRRTIAIILLATAALTAACGSGSKHSAATTSKASAFRPGAGQDAAAIATHIPGCTGVATGTGAGGDLSSTAHCTLAGHTVIVDSFNGVDVSGIIGQLATSRTYFAYGATGWAAIIGDQGVAADQTVLQMQLANDAGGLADLASSGTTPAPAPTDAQQQLATQIAAALGGKVGQAH